VRLGSTLPTSGDGLLLNERLLYFGQKHQPGDRAGLNRTATSDRLVRPSLSDGFDMPTTVACRGGSLYLRNARFVTPATPTTEYRVTRVKK